MNQINPKSEMVKTIIGYIDHAEQDHDPRMFAKKEIDIRPDLEKHLQKGIELAQKINLEKKLSFQTIAEFHVYVLDCQNFCMRVSLAESLIKQKMKMGGKRVD